MFLKVARKGLKLPSLNNNIKCGNSIIDDADVALDKAFNWNDEFEEIMDNGGFDIIIGNPPYISQQTNNKEHSKKEKDYLKNNYYSAYGSYDIYVLFVEKGINLLKDKGVLSYIIPNKFINAVYGEKIKEFINNYHLKTLIDFDDYPIFPDAKNYTCIINIKKEDPSKTLYVNRIESPKEYLNNQRNPNCKYKEIIVNKEQILDWILLDETEIKIINKLESYNKLSNIVDNIWEGLRPGYEKAYIVYDKEIIEENLDKNLLKKFIKNEDIFRYSVNLNGSYNNPKHLIFPYDSNLELINIEEYPNVESYLNQFIDKLYDSNGKDNKILRYEYYHLPSEILNKNLIVTPDISKRNSFAVLDEYRMLWLSAK